MKKSLEKKKKTYKRKKFQGDTDFHIMTFRSNRRKFPAIFPGTKGRRIVTNFGGVKMGWA